MAFLDDVKTNLEAVGLIYAGDRNKRQRGAVYFDMRVLGYALSERTVGPDPRAGIMYQVRILTDHNYTKGSDLDVWNRLETALSAAYPVITSAGGGPILSESDEIESEQGIVMVGTRLEFTNRRRTLRSA